MRQFATLIFLTIFVQTLQGQNAKEYELPGFVQINDSLFISRFEISIREYGAFLLFLEQKQKDNLLAKQCLPKPNTTDWTIWSGYRKSLTTFDNEIYELHDTTVSFTTVMGNLPVVNISKSQASEYCNFRRLDYSIFLQTAKDKQKKKLPLNLTFRLLTENEWTNAASFIADTSNIICLQFFERDSLKERRPMPVFQGSTNALGLFNMAGNVAELVADSDNIFGGSYKDSLKDCNSTSQKNLVAREHEIGFRIAAVVR